MRSLRYDAYLEQTKFSIAERLEAFLHVDPLDILITAAFLSSRDSVLRTLPETETLLPSKNFGYKGSFWNGVVAGAMLGFSERSCNYTYSQAH